MPISDPLDEDPGWQMSPRVLAMALIPGYAMSTGKGRDTLTQIRQTFVAFASMLVIFQIIVAFLGTDPEVKRNTPIALGFLAAGLLTLLVSDALGGRKPLECTDEDALVTNYRARFFLRVAFANAAALYGFVGFFVANVWWVYPASLITAAIGFARLAPTREHLIADQEALRSQGCQLMLVRALRQPSAS